VPPSEAVVDAFWTTKSVIGDKLDSIIAWTPNDSEQGLITAHEFYNPSLLNPRSGVRDIRKYVEGQLPLQHLHFITASDVTLVSLSWCHAVMDGVGGAQLVAAWKREIAEPNHSDIYSDTDPATIFDFTQDVDISGGWHTPWWPSTYSFGFLKGMLGKAYEAHYHPLLNGSIYIPSAMLTRWRKAAAAEMHDGEYVSSNDLVAAWIFKYAWGVTYHADSDWNTLFTAVCARGKHPALPISIITNTAKSSAMPPIRTADLRKQSLAQTALSLRKSLRPFSDEEHVAKFVTEEYRRVKRWNGRPTSVPDGIHGARVCGITSWAKQDMGNFTVRGTEALSCLTYNADRCVASVIDTADDWRVDYKMARRQWAALEVQMAVENAHLRG